MTAHLLPLAQRLIAIELDVGLAAGLRARFAGSANFELVEADVLPVDLGQWGPAVIAGNLPYYITSPILERALAAKPKLAVFLVQKEVALRLAARPGSRDYGYLSVRTQFLADVEVLFEVAPGAFQPPPKVDSAVVRLKPRGVDAPGDFLKFAGLCFQHKRKNLRNNLSGAFPGVAFAESGLRAEQLSVEQLYELWQRLTKAHPIY